VRTVRRLLDHYQIRRTRQTIAQREFGARAPLGAGKGVWQAQRQARLAQLGFTDLAAYLHTCMVQEGWSVPRIRAELQVRRAWLVEQQLQLGLRRKPDGHHNADHHGGHCLEGVLTVIRQAPDTVKAWIAPSPDGVEL